MNVAKHRNTVRSCSRYGVPIAQSLTRRVQTSLGMKKWIGACGIAAIATAIGMSSSFSTWRLSLQFHVTGRFLECVAT